MTDSALIERITRSLAFMLRHQPETFDLEVDAFGFAPLDEVVRALNERVGEPVVLDDVITAVGAGDRVRYEIQGDKIRALYGHSIAVEPGPASKPPDTLFVAIPESELERAQRFGLRGGRRRFLHLAKTLEDARESGRRAAREYAVLSIRALDAWEEGVNFYDRVSLWLAEEVPTHLLEVEGTYDDGTEPMRGRSHEPRRGGRGGRGGRGRGDDRRGRSDERRPRRGRGRSDRDDDDRQDVWRHEGRSRDDGPRREPAGDRGRRGRGDRGRDDRDGRRDDTERRGRGGDRDRDRGRDRGGERHRGRERERERETIVPASRPSAARHEPAPARPEPAPAASSAFGAGLEPEPPAPASRSPRPERPPRREREKPARDEARAERARDSRDSGGDADAAARESSGDDKRSEGDSSLGFGAGL